MGLYPTNIGLYKIALRHRSASVHISNGISINNERLEFLGDAIIDSIVAEFLFRHYPDKKEGFLTQMRAKIVSRTTLNRLAKHIYLEENIISYTRHNVVKKNIYGNAFEALAGAVYLDKGYKETYNWLIHQIILKYIDLDKLETTEIDFKSRLIEWGQKNKTEVLFQTNETDDEHSKIQFVSEIFVDKKMMGQGKGSSKKSAEQKAAKKVLKEIQLVHED